MNAPAMPKIIEKTIQLEDLEMDPELLAEFIASDELANLGMGPLSGPESVPQPMPVQSDSGEVNTLVFPITAALRQKLGRVKEIRDLSVKTGTNLETARLLLELPTDIVMDFSSALRGSTRP